MNFTSQCNSNPFLIPSSPFAGISVSYFMWILDVREFIWSQRPLMHGKNTRSHGILKIILKHHIHLLAWNGQYHIHLLAWNVLPYRYRVFRYSAEVPLRDQFTSFLVLSPTLYIATTDPSSYRTSDRLLHILRKSILARGLHSHTSPFIILGLHICQIIDVNALALGCNPANMCAGRFW